MIRAVEELLDEAVKREVLAITCRMLSAPKARGMDDVAILCVDGAEKDLLTAWLRRHGEETGRPGLVRDAGNVDRARAVVLLGSRPVYLDLDCGMCGRQTCDLAKADDANCIYPLVDMGIALGSGVSMAAEHGLDNRVMYSLGLAALRTGVFAREPGVRSALGVPFSVTSKNVFFDRTR